MNTNTKKQILEKGFDACMQNHLCGNYISMSDIQGLESSDIEWRVDSEKSAFIAFTEYGTYSYNYDFDSSFDDNLASFVDELRDFLCKEEIC